MQTIVEVRYNRPLIDDVGAPPESKRVDDGETHRVLSDHARWLEERGFAERVEPCSGFPSASDDPSLLAFLAELEGSMQGGYPNKAIAPAETQTRPIKGKRGRPKGSKNRPK